MKNDKAADGAASEEASHGPPSNHPAASRLASQSMLEAAARPDDAPLTPSTPAERRRAFQLLYVALMFMGMGQTMMFAVLPQITRGEFGLAEWKAGAIISLSGFIWFFSSPYWGNKSDEWGRKPVILIGLLGYAVSTVSFGAVIQVGLLGLLPVAIVYPGMIFARSIFGLFGPGAQAGSQAYIVDRTTSRNRTDMIAALSSSFGVGTFIGPVLAGGLVVFGLVTPFYVFGVIVAICAVLVWRFLPERTPPMGLRNSRPLRAMMESLTDRRILPFSLYGFLLSLTQAIPMQTIAFYTQDMLKLEQLASIQLASVSIMASALAALFAQLVLIQRFHLASSTLMRFGGFLGLLAFASLALAANYSFLVLAMVLSGLGFGMARPGHMAASSFAVSQQEQGKVAGVIGSTAALGFVTSPLIVLPVYQWRPEAPYMLGFVLVCLLLIANYTLRAFQSEQVVRGTDEPDVGMDRG